MANIVIAPVFLRANVNVTFALARRLQSRGHRVVYASIPDTEEYIRRQGFDVVPIFSDVFPRGTLASHSANDANGKYVSIAELNAKDSAMCSLCLNGEIAKATDNLHPDLFLVSNHLPWVGIGAWKTGAPVIMFSSVFVSKRDAMVPPITSDVIPSRGWLSRFRVSWEWQSMMLRRKWMARLSGLSKSSDYLKNLALGTGYPLNDIDFDVLPWPRLSLPELIFFPDVLDFERAVPIKGAFYVEPCVDTARNEKEFPWERLDARPLIYCSLGTLAVSRYIDLSRRFFQALLQVMAERQDLQAVVTIGNHLKPEEFVQPPNVILTAESPQVALLKRATLMVGHAGSGCLRESIYHGVPMLLLPIFFDQPGNAARAVYHHVALRADFRTVSAQELRSAIDKLLTDASYSEAAKRMSQTFVQMQEQMPSASIIESALAGNLN